MYNKTFVILKTCLVVFIITGDPLKYALYKARIKLLSSTSAVIYRDSLKSYQGSYGLNTLKRNTLPGHIIILGPGTRLRHSG